MKLLNYFKYSWTFFENAKVKFIGYIFLRLFSMLLSLTSPLLYAVLITYITQKNQKWAIIVLCVSTGVQFLAILVNYFLGLLESKVKREVTCNAQKRLMSKLLSIPPFLLKDFQDGNLLGIISRDANCPVVFIFALLNGLYNIITVIIIGIVVFILSWQLSVALLLTYPIIYIINFIFGKKLGKKQKEMLYRADGLLAYLKNSISELTFIKENNGEDKTIIGFDKNVFWANKTSFEMEKLKLRNGLCIQTVGVLNYVLLNSIGIILVISNKMLFSNYIAFNGYSSRFGKALTGIVSLNSALQPSFVVLDRLMDIERISLEVEEKRKFKKKLHVGKNIKIKVENLSICLLTITNTMSTFIKILMVNL